MSEGRIIRGPWRSTPPLSGEARCDVRAVMQQMRETLDGRERCTVCYQPALRDGLCLRCWRVREAIEGAP